MKALTIRQPWATLVISGAKRYETRTWQTDYRGLLAIHSSSTFTPYAKSVCSEQRFFEALFKAGIEDLDELPLGAVLGVVRLKDTFPIRRRTRVPVAEYRFGDWREDRYAWKFERVLWLKDPVPYRGARSLWEFPEEKAPSVRDLVAALT